MTEGVRAELTMAIAVRSCFYQNLSKHRKMTMVSIVFLDCFYIRFVVSVPLLRIDHFSAVS